MKKHDIWDCNDNHKPTYRERVSGEIFYCVCKCHGFFNQPNKRIRKLKEEIGRIK